MYVDRVFNPWAIIRFTLRHILIFVFYSTLVVCLYYFFDFTWLKIPWVPLTLLGVALAFYVGFKNNSAYERTWEARKIWGGIVNSSRSWAAMVTGFVTNEFASKKVSEEELKAIHKRLIYRHIAWLYRLKRQLRTLRSWEHNRRINKRYRLYIETLFPTEDPDKELQNFLNDEEVQRILSVQNGCTHLIHEQSKELKELKSRGLIDDFRHMELQNLLNEFYTLQGKSERIKNFPIPRVYASLSIYFVHLFIFLLPFGLLSAYADANIPEITIWSVIPFTALIGWIFWLMESAGDYAENPFEALAFDVPITSLTRTIEIDLKEMLRETDLPEPITPKDGFLI